MLQRTVIRLGNRITFLRYVRIKNARSHPFLFVLFQFFGRKASFPKVSKKNIDESFCLQLACFNVIFNFASFSAKGFDDIADRLLRKQRQRVIEQGLRFKMNGDNEFGVVQQRGMRG